MDKEISAYLAKIGRLGGKRSRRVLTRESAQLMVQVREARRAFRRFYNQCFWSFDPKYQIGVADIDWVASQLKKNGGREAWEVASKLHRKDHASN